jgi:hypothetical protein
LQATTSFLPPSTGRAERGWDDICLLLIPINGCTRTLTVHGTVLRNEILFWKCGSAAYILMGSEPPTCCCKWTDDQSVHGNVPPYLEISIFNRKPGSFLKRALLHIENKLCKMTYIKPSYLPTGSLAELSCSSSSLESLPGQAIHKCQHA